MAIDVPVPFNLKYFDQIAASEMNWLVSAQNEVTDFNIGSVNRTMMEAAAMEMEELYMRLFSAIEQAIPLAVFRAFDFTLDPATSAQGVVSFSRSTPAPAPVLIPAGTAVATIDGLIFTTISDATIGTNGTTVDTSVQSSTSGVGGNVSAGSIAVIPSSIVGVETVTNALAITGGQDSETEDALKLRFQGFISSLARTPTSGIEAGGKTAKIVDPQNGATIEHVVLNALVEPYKTDTSQPSGVVLLYIDNGTGSASAALVAECQKVIDGYTDQITGVESMGYRAAGIVVRVLSVVARPVDVTATITARDGFALDVVEANVRATIAAIFAGLKIGEALDWEKLLSGIFTTLGVLTVVQDAPVNDVATAENERVTPGTITLTVIPQ